MRARAILVAAGSALAALLAGCATVPTSGPIRSGSGAGDVGDPPFGVQVQAPRPGAGARAIVNDFLDAMATSGADILKQYLTPQAAAKWRPDDSVTVFDRSDKQSIQQERTLDGATEVTLDGPKVATLDPRGGWHGVVPGEAPVKFTFRLVKVDGELRISNAPDRRLVASDLFTTNYRARNLYFFTPKWDALVPDPVYVPVRTPSAQNATALAQSLLSGPARLGDSVLSAAPQGTEVVSVTVDADGIATVALNDRVAGLGPDQRLKLAAQLAWTLRQVGVLKLKITSAGQPYEIDGTTGEQPVSRWDSYDAAFASLTGRQLYVLNNSAIDRLDNIDSSGQQKPASPVPIEGLRNFKVQSLAVDLEGQNAAAVTDGAVVLGPTRKPPRDQTVRILTAGSVLRPSFDKDRNLWIVDQADGATRIRVRRETGRMLTVRAPGLEGKKVTAFRVARDGVRVLVVVQTGQRSQVMLGRITGNNRSERVSGLEPLQLGFDEITGAGWSSPTKIMVLGRTGDRQYQMVEANVDGSQLATIQGNGVQDFNPTELASAPDGDALPVVLNNGDLLVRARDLNWEKLARPGHAVYPG